MMETPFLTDQAEGQAKKPRAMAIDQSTCCRAQYAWLTGRVDARGNKLPPDLVCSICHAPAPDDHPEKVEMVRDWEAKQAELAAAKVAPPRDGRDVGAALARVVALEKRLAAAGQA
jgi:hypothetical protein